MKINFQKYREKFIEKVREHTPEIGFLRQNISIFEAVALISSGTIGAGVLGVPYAVAKVGIPLGLAYIFFVGLLIIGLHLLVGSIILRTKKEAQIVGLAKEYLGKIGGSIVGVLLYVMLIGTLVVYIIGEGQTLSSLFGGSSFWWSTGFFVLASTLIYIGLETVKKVELILTGAILSVILLIAGLSSPFVDSFNIQYVNLAELLFPYGVLLFAFHGATFVPEAHKILRGDEEKFKKAIVIAGLITMIVYAIFAFVTVGVTGPNTTQVATIGLGQEIGNYMLVLGNIFAAIAMATSFLVVGLSVKDSVSLDYNLPNWAGTVFACGAPFVVFLFGLRNFIAAIDIVGGVVMSLEMIALIFIYWIAKQQGDLEPTNYQLHHTLLFAIVALIAFTIGAIYSSYTLFL